MASKKVTTRQLIESLAKERGIDVTDLDKLRGSGVKGRLQEGSGFGEAFLQTGKEKITDVKEAFSKKGVKQLGRKAYQSFFSGDDIFSAYMRGKLNKKGNRNLEKKEMEDDVSGEAGDSGFTRVIAKESMMLPGVARDMNLMRQNIQKLVKLWSSKGDIDDAKGKPYAQGADDFFMREDQKESELESMRDNKKRAKDADFISGRSSNNDNEGGILDSIMSFFSKGFMVAIKKLFNVRTLMKVFSKVFLPLTIIGTLFSGIKDGFKKYQETGSFSEAIISGLGGMLDFLTFGIFGEDTIKTLFDSLSNLFSPITNIISSIFTGIKDFFVKLFGGEVKVQEESAAPITASYTSDARKGIYDEMGNFTGMYEDEPEPPKKPTEKPSTEAPTPRGRRSRYPSKSQEAKLVEKVGGEKIKLPEGVQYESAGGSYRYKNINFTANNQKEFDIIKKSIDDKKIVEFQTEDRNARLVTKSFNGATGDISLLPPKPSIPSPIVMPGASTTPVSASRGGASSGGSVSSGGASSGGSVSSGGAAGGGSVSADSGSGSGGKSITSSPTTPSGSTMNSASSDVAESQRMESAADSGSIVNSPTNNVSKSNQSESNKKSSDVYDSDLAFLLGQS